MFAHYCSYVVCSCNGTPLAWPTSRIICNDVVLGRALSLSLSHFLSLLVLCVSVASAFWHKRNVLLTLFQFRPLLFDFLFVCSLSRDRNTERANQTNATTMAWKKKHRFKVQTVEVMKIKILHFFCWSAHMLVNTFNAISLVFGSVFYFLLSLSFSSPILYLHLFRSLPLFQSFV